jgi:hypothetical protein
MYRPDFARGGPPPANPKLINHAPEFYPQPDNPPQGWTYAGFLTIAPGPSGRGANTIWWMGLINSFWWIDREKGVAGFLGGQVSEVWSTRCWKKMLIHPGFAKRRPEDYSCVVHVREDDLRQLEVT